MWPGLWISYGLVMLPLLAFLAGEFRRWYCSRSGRLLRAYAYMHRRLVTGIEEWLDTPRRMG